MLVCVTIIGTLAALLLPVVSKTRRGAQTAGCVSNLRQLGVAVQSYVADKETYPPGIMGSSDAMPGSTWRITLRPYMGIQDLTNDEKLNSKIITCPAYEIVPPLSGIYPTYSVNSRLMPDRNSSPLSPLVRPPAVNRPSEILLFADATQRSTGGSHSCLGLINAYYFNSGDPSKGDRIVDSSVFSTVQPCKPTETASDIRFRHQSKANILYVDGHVGAINPNELKWKNLDFSY